MSGINTEHVLILVIVAFMLYHFMNRCGNGFSVGGDCWDWDSEFTCLASNSAFWSEDCEWKVGSCVTETEANRINAQFAASIVARKAAMGMPPTATALAIGGFLFVSHLVGAQLGDSSLNPARSLGPAIVQGGDALKIVWVFVAAPIVGGLIGCGLFRILYGEEKEDGA